MIFIFITKPRNWLCMECTQKYETENCDRLPNKIDLSSSVLNQSCRITEFGPNVLIHFDKKVERVFVESKKQQRSHKSNLLPNRHREHLQIADALSYATCGCTNFAGKLTVKAGNVNTAEFNTLSYYMTTIFITSVLNIFVSSACPVVTLYKRNEF